MTTDPIVPTEENPLRSVEYIAKVCEVSEYTVRTWIKSGKLSGRKVGGEWRVLNSDFVAYVNQEYGS